MRPMTMRAKCLKRRPRTSKLSDDILEGMDPDTEPPKPKRKKAKKQSGQWGFGVMVLSDDQYWGGSPKA